eukprot:TRINITY_DN3260_c0_g2_i5.p2 TRINITY_DN3260_c0_g2~~TRINITY_DN3260_c0_g2_i5.p2  ORF type:complete len:676 (-),score=170.16 TRINITY_DN3260_c0_g2_i5:3573-5600(-)
MKKMKPVLGPTVTRDVKREPRHNPNAPGAVVLDNTPGSVPVVLDPYIATKMRPHQHEGVKFMYRCIMGLQGSDIQGCILADEMGLGKTLQAIALIWTLLKQGPTGLPAIKKAVVACPNSLVQNWENEFRRWLGVQRVCPAVLVKCSKEKTVQTIRDFTCDVRPVLIISYEMLRKHIELVDPSKVGLLVCDEGHRLKNALSQTSKALWRLTIRRVVLSGTPIQNDLDEFYTMIDFCNPGFLGESADFKREYQRPIERSLVPTASQEERYEGEEKARTLSARLAPMLLRRSAMLLRDFLPPRTEQVVFCALSPLQLTLYRHCLKSKAVSGILSESGQNQALLCMQALIKLCNCPTLLYPRNDKPAAFEGLAEAFPTGFVPTAKPEMSGKLAVLHALLKAVRETTRDKVVVVSNYTKTLDVLEVLLQGLGYQYLRLDGSTPGAERQHMVDQFNDASSPCVIMLLSTKAGGQGLNLIGGNRLVLYDPDWNPAQDRQAMARVWRDGQKKEVFIYRLLSTGSIEEKIFQRQLAKQHLSADLVEDSLLARAAFEPDFLKRVFTLNTNTSCDTHDAVGCGCLHEDEEKAAGSASGSGLSTESLSQYKHLAGVACVDDPVLRALPEPAGSLVTFVLSFTQLPNGAATVHEKEDGEAEAPPQEKAELPKARCITDDVDELELEDS